MSDGKEDSMSEAAPAPHKRPPPPFDSPDADAILRSSDHVDFRVHKVVLSLASPFFRNMYALPTPADIRLSIDDSTGGDPDIPRVAEDSGLLDTVLRFCYPGPDPVIPTLGALLAAVEVLHKYEMDGVTVQARRQLATFAKAHPLVVFAVACRYRWGDLARMAARCALKLPLRDNFTPEGNTFTYEQLRHVSAEDYLRFLEYHWQCSEVAAKILRNLDWVGSFYDFVYVKWAREGLGPLFDLCRRPNTECRAGKVRLPRDASIFGGNNQVFEFKTRQWFLNYMERAAAVVQSRPSAPLGTVALIDPALKESATCPFCGPLAYEALTTFIEKTLSPQIEMQLGKVVLKLSF
ncbi:hypothetical protein B0H10DRAFT_2226860 [Mycena sp. CBHHK59/15]|nr:hypothetical protein B0H10DRAFT_2226860 [Mycena sp. CBHHK59/15]